MFSIGKHLVALATLPLATFAMAAPTPIATVESPNAPANAPVPVLADAPAAAPTVLNLPAPSFADPQGELGALLAETAVSWRAEAAPAAATRTAAADDDLDPELECMAKVVHHEAGHQSRAGQLAVAQLIMNRMESGRFASTICGVANQPGQFFRTASYNPPRNTAAWAAAVDVARQARDGSSEKVAPGALFFHAAYASAGSFFRGRQRVATLGGNVFYR